MKQQTMQELQQELVSKKVLITGIDGFTGIHLEKLLIEKGYAVFGTVLLNTNNNRHLKCDLTKPNEINAVIEKVKPDYIFHLAGVSFVGEQNKSLIYDVNVIGTENLLNAILKAKLHPQKIIIASSATVYGNQKKSVLDEKMCPKPVNHYGYSKLIMEHLVETYFTKLNILITRPFNYTGPHQAEHFLIPKIIKHFKERKEFIELGNTNVAREFNHVIDVSNLYFKLMLSNTNSTVVNLCTGRAIYLLDIIECLNKLAGYKIKIKTNPELVRNNEIVILKGSIEKLNSIILNDFKKSIEETLSELYLNID